MRSKQSPFTHDCNRLGHGVIPGKILWIYKTVIYNLSMKQHLTHTAELTGDPIVGYIALINNVL